jgi:hypothetical protein
MISIVSTATLFVGLRFLTRWKNAGFGIDDWILLVALVSYVVCVTNPYLHLQFFLFGVLTCSLLSKPIVKYSGRS